MLFFRLLFAILLSYIHDEEYQKKLWTKTHQIHEHS